MDIPPEVAAGERLRRNLLLGRSTASAAGAVRALCGIQAQELLAARMGVRARSRGLTDKRVEKARTAERLFVRTWAMRGTLHLVASADLPWLRRLLAPGIIRAGARRSAELGLDEATYRRSIDVMDQALAGGRVLGRGGLKEALVQAGIDPSGQRMVYLLARASAEGLICEGPLKGRNAAYVRVDDWLGPTAAVGGDRPDDLERLVIRYLDAYGPAGPRDLAAWSGLAVSECREAFRLAEGDLSELSVAGGSAWITGDSGGTGASGLKLLPAFDTFLLGYRDRGLHVDPADARRVNAGGGMVRPVILLDGRVAGIWGFTRRGNRVQVVVKPFEALPKRVDPDLDAELADLGRFLEAQVDAIVEPGLRTA